MIEAANEDAPSCFETSGARLSTEGASNERRWLAVVAAKEGEIVDQWSTIECEAPYGA
jgi:hypothetical protein